MANELLDTNIGVSGTTRGVLTLDRGASTNTPGTIVLEALDGTEYYLWAAANGDIRRHTSLPTADTNGLMIAQSHAAQIAMLDNSTPVAAGISTTAWTAFNGFESSHTHTSGDKLTATVGADDYIDVSSTGAGAYKFRIEANAGPDSGTNQAVAIGIGIGGSDPTEFTQTGIRTLSIGATEYWGRTFIADLANSDRVRLYFQNQTAGNDINVYYVGLIIEYLGA